MTIIRVDLAKVPMILLRQLHGTGLYGHTLEKTAEVLICEELRRRLREDDLILRLPPLAPKRGRKG